MKMSKIEGKRLNMLFIPTLPVKGEFTAMHTVSFLFKISDLKKLVKLSRYEKYYFVTRFVQKLIFHEPF